ncbi:hypothetical protein F4781DRAFT_294162 [Annulohypoxylon bovei var. microspora]|nr:hypothetical protein F4781DRAFT_294162 [Annulohypoxylon bovei var. microspora]
MHVVSKISNLRSIFFLFLFLTASQVSIGCKSKSELCHRLGLNKAWHFLGTAGTSPHRRLKKRKKKRSSHHLSPAYDLSPRVPTRRQAQSNPVLCLTNRCDPAVACNGPGLDAELLLTYPCRIAQSCHRQADR